MPPPPTRRWPIYLALKTNRAYVQENQGTVGNGDSTLKGLKRRLTYPRTQCKSSNMKSAQIICERDSFANLKASARGPGACWDSRGQRHWWVPFFAFALYLASTSRHCFCTSPLICWHWWACPTPRATPTVPAKPGSGALLWRSGGLHFWAPWVCNSEEQFLESHHPQSTAGSTLNHPHPPISLCKRPNYLSWGISLRGSLKITTCRGYRSALRECRMGNTISALTLGLAVAHGYLPERSSHTGMELWFLQLSLRDTSRSPGWEKRRVHDRGPTGQYMFAYLNSCCLRV